MTAYTPDQDADTERLLIVSLEARDRSGNGDWRHIRAEVVRRAKSHVPREDGNGYVAYFDDTNATGYRMSEWSSNKSTALWLDGLCVRGQIDAYGPTPLNERKPYGNELQFSCYAIKHREAKRMADTFAKLERKRVKLEEAGHVFRDTFADAARALALSLGIKRFIVRRPAHHGNLSDTRSFRELPLKDLEFEVDQLVASTGKSE